MDDANTQRIYSESELLAAIHVSGSRAIERLMEALATEDAELCAERIKFVVGHLCARLFYAGYEAAITEAAAQILEAGIAVVLDKPDQLFADSGPLNDGWEWE